MKILILPTMLLALSASALAETAKPAAAPPPLEAYGKLPRIEQLALSDDGAQIALVTAQDDVRYLLTYSLADKVKHIVKLGPGKIRDLTWGDDDHVLIEVSRPMTIAAFAGKHEFAQVTSINIKKGAGAPLPDKIDQDYGVIWSRPITAVINGKQRIFAVYLAMSQEVMFDQANDRFYLCEIDPETGHAKVVDDGGGDLDRKNRAVYDWLLGPNGDIIARTTYGFSTERYSVEMRVGGAWKAVLSRPVDFKRHTYEPEIIGLGRDGKSVVIEDAIKEDIETDRPERRTHFYEVSATGEVSGPLEPAGGGSHWAMFHLGTKRLIGFRHWGEREETDIFDPEMKALYDKAKSAAPGEAVVIRAFAHDPRKMIIHAEASDDPGTYYALDFSTGAAVSIGEDYPKAPTEWIGAQKPITYKAADGLEIHGFLTLPPGRDPKNLPLIVLPHGGPQARDYPGFDWWAQALASRGYAVLQPNYRGSDGYGRAFIDKGHGEWGRKMQTDLSDGVRDLAKQGLIDPKRVCIVGASYGGYAALAGAAIDRGPYRCAAAVAGVSDLHSMLDWQARQTNPYDSNSVRYWKTFWGPESGWDEVSPYKQAAKVDIPVLLVHGRDDTVVTIRQSEMMRDALRSNGKTVEYVELRGEDHWLSTEATRLQMLQAVVAFVEKYNPPTP